MKRIVSFVLILVVCLGINVVFSEKNKEVSSCILGSRLLFEEEKDILRRYRVSHDDMLSLVQQIEAYNPTVMQIRNYIDDLVHNRVGKNAEYKRNTAVAYAKTKNGDTITPYGVVPFRELHNKWNDTALFTVSTLSDRTNYNDQSGVYYCVKSKSGYNQMTSFVELPTLETVHVNDRPYQMFTFNTSSRYAAYGDVGLVYFPSINRWKGFYNIVDNGTRREDYTIEFTGGSRLYFHLQFYNSPDKVVLTIRDASSWSSVAVITYIFSHDCVDSSFSTTRMAKEVTLAQHNNGTLNIRTGTKMKNAKYSETYLYSRNGYYPFSSDRCYEAFRMGPTVTAYSTVRSTYTTWTSDNVSISFD